MWSTALLMVALLTQPPAPQVPVPEPRPSAERADAPVPPEVAETVVVSATRSDRLLEDEPLRVEVIGREEIEEKALMTPGSVGMLLGETTGLRVQMVAPTTGAANVRIQGLRGRYAQMLADGLPVYGAGGDSLSLLQVPPLDLGQVEIIKGAASALYGPAALGGVINLVSRRPTGIERQLLLNTTSQGGTDATFWFGSAPAGGWSWTLLAGRHGQARQDTDADGWADVAEYQRWALRPRVFFDRGTGTSVVLTGGFITERRQGGTMDGRVAPDGRAFDDLIDTRRGDIGGVARWLLGRRVVSVRGSYARTGQDRVRGGVRERGVRQTSFGEASLTGTHGRHTYVIGGAVQQDRFAPEDVARFRYTFSSPAVFAQDEITVSRRVSLSGSARLDAHSEYGTLVSPRVSLLYRPSQTWTARLSAGTGWFAPTPFSEETDDIGLSRVAALSGLVAERARTASADLTWRRGAFDITATLFGSRIGRPVQLVQLTELDRPGSDPCAAAFQNAPEPARTWGTEWLGRYRRGGVTVMATHAYTRATEFDVDTGIRREVPLTPRHASSFNVMYEGEAWGRAGLEVYYIGRQSLDDNPYRRESQPHTLIGGLYEHRFGRVRLFINGENLGNVKQTNFDTLLRPMRAADGRWTVDAWAPLDGRVINGGLRLIF